LYFIIDKVFVLDIKQAGQKVLVLDKADIFQLSILFPRVWFLNSAICYVGTPGKQQLGRVVGIPFLVMESRIG